MSLTKSKILTVIKPVYIGIPNVARGLNSNEKIQLCSRTEMVLGFFMTALNLINAQIKLPTSDFNFNGCKFQKQFLSIFSVELTKPAFQ